jgi:hypothetical protein
MTEQDCRQKTDPGSVSTPTSVFARVLHVLAFSSASFASAATKNSSMQQSKQKSVLRAQLLSCV